MIHREFQKIPRLSREIVITEKIDGTNGLVAVFHKAEVNQTELLITPVPYIEVIHGGMSFFLCAGSKSRWISPSDDNFGFARWVHEHSQELVTLGPGMHYGEWWGSGIQRGYGLTKGEKRWSLFNCTRWTEEKPPACCHVVPELWRGPFDTHLVEFHLGELARTGSRAAPGFMKPEGVIVYHTAGGYLFKKTIEKDHEPKGKNT